MQRAAVATVALFLLAGCPSDQGIGGGPNENTAQPILRVEPGFLAFGPVDRDAFAENTFTVANDGDASLELMSFTINGSAAFAVTDAQLPLTLEEGEEQEFTVRYAGLNLQDRGELRVTATAGQAATATIDLVGETKLPVLEIAPV